MRIAVIGAGPAGLIAAISAAQAGASKVTIFEKNPLPGRKLLLTGNGRCNLTNSLDISDYPMKYFGNGKFLYTAIGRFGPTDLVDFFEKQSVRLREEDNGRIFPESGRAQDVLNVLFARTQSLHIHFREAEAVIDLRKNKAGRMAKVMTQSDSYEADAVILCAGGSSYPTTGSSGDGFLMAARLGHTIIPVRPGLAPVDTDPSAVKDLQGISLHDIGVQILQDGKVLGKCFGDILFTHFGLTGPAVLRLSRNMPLNETEYRGGVQIQLDLWPQLPYDRAKERMMTLLSSNLNKKIMNALRTFWPEAIVSFLLERAAISEDVYCRDLNKHSRKRLVKEIKEMCFYIRKPPMFSGAMVTAGGISLKEIDPKTMQSRLVPGLYFAGEVIDIDGESGGFNLQAAFSTGLLAGQSAATAMIEGA